MKRNVLISFFAFMAMMFSCVCLVSCSDDDDNGGGGDSSLVGTWIEKHSSYTSGWKFYSNGKCCYGEWGAGSPEEWDTEDDMSYSAGDGILVVTIRYEDGDSDVERFNYVITETEKGTVLTLSGEDIGMSGKFVKQ